MNSISRLGLLIIISSSSGTGKTTICKKLISSDKNLYLSISVTTRKNETMRRRCRLFFKSKRLFKFEKARCFRKCIGI